VAKPDDSSLTPAQLRAVEERVVSLLNRSEAWGRVPTPLEDILAAAKLRVESKSLKEADGFLAFLKSKSIAAASMAMDTLKAATSAFGKILGICDSADHAIYIDDTVNGSKQTFLTLHETGHHEMPHQRRLFRFFEDNDKSLEPDVAELFEREANNFARHALFQGDGYAKMAADHDLEKGMAAIKKLGPKFGASIYASAREFARTNYRACLVVVLNPSEYAFGVGLRAEVRRIEASALFKAQFPLPQATHITPDHPLGSLLPSPKQRVVKPRSVVLEDFNGARQECVAEAFNTTHNTIILLYPTKALTKTTVILPPGFKQAVNF